MAIKRQNPFKGGKRLGNDAPGEPADNPMAQFVGGYKGSPTFGGTHNRGEKAVNPMPESEIHPKPYGGGNPVVTRPNAKKVRGGGANTGAGATSAPSE